MDPHSVRDWMDTVDTAKRMLDTLKDYVALDILLGSQIEAEVNMVASNKELHEEILVVINNLDVIYKSLEQVEEPA